MSTQQQAKHTPGPWKLETVATQVGICHKIGSFPSRGTRGESYACVYVDGYPAGLEGTDPVSLENRANAQLMAAAPDLLAALQYIVAWEPEGWSADEARRLAVAAITKATGEDQ